MNQGVQVRPAIHPLSGSKSDLGTFKRLLGLGSLTGGTECVTCLHRAAAELAFWN